MVVEVPVLAVVVVVVVVVALALDVMLGLKRWGYCVYLGLLGCLQLTGTQLSFRCMLQVPNH
jgi:hypothetical protein